MIDAFSSIFNVELSKNEENFLLILTVCLVLVDKYEICHMLFLSIDKQTAITRQIFLDFFFVFRLLICSQFGDYSIDFPKSS